MNDLVAGADPDALRTMLRDIAARDLLGRFTDTHSLPHIAALAESISAAQYFVANMQNAARFIRKPDYIDHALAARSVDGLLLEFGVATGQTINHIAAALPRQTVYGFYVFTGLPEDWRPGFPAGSFRQPALPPVRENVELIVGLFQDSLPGFVDTHPGPISLLHVDCDLYSATKTIFRYLGHRLVTGSIILFDEYLNYPGWRQGEFKAFQEFLAWSGQSYEYISMVSVHQQVAVRITSG
ncbi:class I SAM-dependent methyltransferase [Rhodopila sp.]|uniref:class I SAM-dependent methyltransferase n=1 Tax=Rhodopila sp. TaxID=2480087 RepID=UPI003D13E257